MREQDGPEKPSRRQLIVDIAHFVTAMSAVAAVVFTVVFTSEANDTAEGSLGVARKAQEQAQSAAERALALKFYIGWVPPGESQGEDISERAVINASAVDMYDVMVRGSVTTPREPPEDHVSGSFLVDPEPIGGSEGYIRLEPFHACTGYTLPADFEVKEVYFFDGATYWVRYSDGRLGKRSDQERDWDEPKIVLPPLNGREPYKATTGPRAFDARSCS